MTSMPHQEFMMTLVKPDIRYEESFRAGFSELQTQSDKFSWIYLGESSYEKYFSMSFSEYTATLRQRETTPAPNFVCDSVYWAIMSGEVVGRISMRHDLTEFLTKVGGHVGYIVRPSFRGKGIATEMLRRVLQTERAQSIGQILVTCDESNLASERTIVKCGGRLQDIISLDPSKPRKKRFWLTASDMF